MGFISIFYVCKNNINMIRTKGGACVREIKS